MSDRSEPPRAAPPPLPELPEGTLRELLDHAADGVLLGELRDGAIVVTWLSRGACDLLRASFDELVNRPLGDLLWDPEELAKRPLDLQRLRKGSTVSAHRAMRAGDGSRVVVDVSARSLADGRIVAFTRDVTARVEAQERLIRSESSFRALIERSPDGIAVHRGGRFVYANSAVARILGLESPSQLVGTAVMEVLHPDDRPRAAARIEAMTAGQPSVPFSEERLLRCDGTSVVTSIAALRVEFGGEPSIAVIARDVTEQRRMMTQLAQAERLASIGVLAAGVGHEINNPLTYVILRLGAAAVLERRMRAESVRLLADLESALGVDAARQMLPDERLSWLDDLASHLASAQDGAGRIRQIVSDLRLFSRATDEAMVPLDVRVPLERALAMATHELKHRATVTLDLAATPAVLANEGRLAQVFLNLLLNAVQAIPEGSSEAHVVALRTHAHGGGVVVEIADTGEGIPEDVLPRLFEPFFTTKAVGSGSGLGLAVSHGIVVGLGGRIEVESRIGHGSTFRVVLPPTDVPRTVAPPSPPRSKDLPTRHARILIVDDELSLARAVAMLLERHGEVVVESCGEGAQERLARGESFDVVLCDVVMPVMSGFELFRWMEGNRPELVDRVVFMSGGRLGDDERQHSERHPDRWLSKPFDADRLEGSVLRVLRRMVDGPRA